MGKNKEKIQRKTIDTLGVMLFLIMLGLLVWGLIMIASSSAYTSVIREDRPMYSYIRKQALAEMMGLVLVAIIMTPWGGFVISLFRRSFPRWVLLILAVASVFLLLFIGNAEGGATRWFTIPHTSINVQPAEIVKASLILVLAGEISSYTGLNRLWAGYAVLFGLAAALAAIVYEISDNLSSAMIIAGIGFVMLFVSTKDIKLHFGMVIAGLIIASLFVQHMRKLPPSAEYDFRTQRVLAWLHPENYMDGTGYQTMQALYAIGSGGVLGKGIGQGIQKLGKVPEVHNDMIFSVVCEETGLLGAAGLIVLFGAMVLCIGMIALKTHDIYKKLVVSGVMAHIAIQVMLNIMVVTAITPNTGVGLPFISYGGSAVLVLMAEVGIVMRISWENACTIVEFKDRKAKKSETDRT
ncbi:MAG: FtsW/RodA/SpoVE family cell cycle protein [Lachnospiraceae bacterium]|nr:FtsW/RodA/SpoVE family cell cycle protein [Lachnospiraceae bacterium]